MKAIGYHAWAETAGLLHMVLQMMGKVKLERMAFQPEWNHSLLYITPNGYTTGLIPDGSSSFSITFDVTAGRVEAACTTGTTAGFLLDDGGTVSEHYAAFCKMLAHLGHDVRINPVPQECFTTTPFDHQDEVRRYDTASARSYFDACTLAYNGLLDFVAPFRGKKILPSLFWGTFDLTCILFAGVEAPFPGKGLIERVAFDEKLVEFGFWPGDTKTDAPSFFALPYPFLEEALDGQIIRPEAAWFSEEKKEFFLPLEAVLAENDPVKAIGDFCHDAFEAITQAESWHNMEWYTKPVSPYTDRPVAFS